MEIGPSNRPDVSQVRYEQKQAEITQTKHHVELKDTVEISNSGREKLKELADSYHKELRNDNEIIEQISPKIARIRNKVEAGYYNLADIESKIADKLADTINIELENFKKME